MASRAAPGLKHLRTIVTEWRKALKKNVFGTKPYNYLISQYRANELTQERLCKAPKELEHLAEYYSTYLRSSRVLKELQEQYQGKGERSVEEVARLVGLKTPKKPSSNT